MTDGFTPPAPSPEPTVEATPRAGGPGLGQIVGGAILVMAGIAWLIDAADWADVPWQALLAAALVIVGAALMYGARHASHGGLITFGIILAVVLALSSAISVLADIPLTGGIGEERLRPITQVEAEYRWGIGSMTLDLRAATVDLEGRTVEASVAIGELIVYVPADVALRVDAHAGIGETRVFGEASGGLDAGVLIAGDGEEAPLVLDLDVAIGKIEVRR